MELKELEQEIERIKERINNNNNNNIFLSSLVPVIGFTLSTLS